MLQDNPDKGVWSIMNYDDVLVYNQYTPFNYDKQNVHFKYN